MGPPEVAARGVVTLLAFLALRWLYGFLHELLVPYEASVALRQVNGSREQAAAASSLLHLDVPMFATVGVALVFLFFVWLWPLATKARQGGGQA
jgi:hypothetical protein